ncbi:MAG TPA: PIN domain-containing protein [Caulobacteraceae bacterium]|jgi:hypothetical protein
MFILDTNILSALMRREPDPPVQRWLDGQAEDLLFTTAIAEAEILAGIALLADGARRRALAAAAEAIFADDFEGRVLAFDTDAAAHYADIFAARRRAGRPIATLDAMIAAIARARGAAVVTLDQDGFEDCGLTVVDPWREAAA